MYIIQNFGERVSELLFEKNLTCEKFSKDVCIDRSVIYRYLRKQSLPSTKNLIAIADYFNCSADFLLGFTSNNLAVTFKPAPPFDKSFRKILSEKHLTRYRLRGDNNFAKQSIDDWFNGKKLPSVDNLVKLSKYFDCSIDYLLGRE